MRKYSGFKPEWIRVLYIKNKRLLTVLSVLIAIFYSIPLLFFFYVFVSHILNSQDLRTDLYIGIPVLIILLSISVHRAFKGSVKQKMVIRIRHIGYRLVEGLEAFMVGIAWLIIEIILGGLIIWFLFPYVFDK